MKKVYVGMSGGVDSSVSAALLQRDGFDVTGVFIKVWQPEWLEETGGCTWREDRLDAMRVAAHIGIPFITIDLEKEYKKEVVDYMIAEYRAGRTPNPDIMCNRYVKFGGFFDWAMAHGADYVATGHYAQVRKNGNDSQLLSGKDGNKDQSYFLWTLTKEQLAKTLFPVGGMEKSETRRLARGFGLPVAEKRDSQGLCFIGKVDIREFLSHYIEPVRGNVLNQSGKVIGHHDGALFLTLGERRGFTVTEKTPDDEPYYIIARDMSANTITVSHKNAGGNLPIEKKEYLLENINVISEISSTDANVSGEKISARIRHLGELMPCNVKMIGKDKIKVVFDEPVIVASGQSVVLYNGDTCLGGGIVA